MPDQQYDISDLLALMPRVSSLDYSSQRHRDTVQSLRLSYGQIAVLVADTAAEAIAAANTYYEVVTPAWTLSDNYNFDESDGNGQLTYIGEADIVALAMLSMTLTGAGDGNLIHAAIGKNGTEDLTSDMAVEHVTGASHEHYATQLLVPMSEGDYLSAFVMNDDDTDNVTVVTAQLAVIGFAA